jgi:hypothetical protein
LSSLEEVIRSYDGSCGFDRSGCCVSCSAESACGERNAGDCHYYSDPSLPDLWYADVHFHVHFLEHNNECNLYLVHCHKYPILLESHGYSCDYDCSDQHNVDSDNRQ